MKFKIDENLPAELAADLRAAVHEADTVHDEGLTGAADSAPRLENLERDVAVMVQ